jgi:hypothetical protein
MSTNINKKMEYSLIYKKALIMIILKKGKGFGNENPL